MKRHLERAFAAVIAICLTLATAPSFADPTTVGDPANPATSGATGVFGEGTAGTAQPDSLSGAMTYSYPFELPPARGAAQPALGLTYSSSSQDREAGYAWGLDVPAIERRPMSGNPRFDGTPSDERFFFSGQPLVRICVLTNCPSGELHPDWAGGGWRYYRLQVEGMFARFYLSQDMRQWRVQLKGGVRMDFGSSDGTNDALEFIDGNPSRIVRWRLVRQLDALHMSGAEPLNYVKYKWKKIGSRGLSYLTDIFDTPRASAHTGDLDFAHHAQLIWELPDYPQTAYADPLHATPDYRLARVGVSSKTWLASTPREITRVYSLRYARSRNPAGTYDPEIMAPLWHHSFLKEVELEGRCGFTEDAMGDIPWHRSMCPLPPVKFWYASGAIGVPNVAAVLSPITGGPPGADVNRRVFFDQESANVLDFNRDGMPDIVQSWQSGPSCLGQQSRSTRVGKPQDGTGDRIGCFDAGWTYVGDVGSSRLMLGYLNRGSGTAYYGETAFAHQCIDAGFDLGQLPQSSPANINAGHASAFLTPQGGATLAGAWGTGVVTWVPDSVPQFKASAFFTEPVARGFAGAGCDPANFNVANFQPAWKWKMTDSDDWAKKGDTRPADVGTNWFADIDGDGLVDELAETGQANAGDFRPGDVHFTRRYAPNEGGWGGVQPTPVQKPFPASSASPGDTLVPASNKPDSRYSYADINGDGLADLVVWHNAIAPGVIARVRLGDGRGNFGCDATKQPWACMPAGADPTAGYEIQIDSPAYSIAADVQFHDVTGDGLSDIVQYEYSGPRRGSVSLWVNVDGHHFACAAPGASCVIGKVIDDLHATFDIGPHRMTFADMNADGVDDGVIIAPVGIFIVEMLQYRPNGGYEWAPRPGLLTRIDNGAGATTQIEYETIQHLDSERLGKPKEWQHHSRAVQAVVVKITTRDTSSVDGTPLPEPYRIRRTVSYDYEEPAYDRWTRSFSGFRKVSVRTGSETAVTVTTNWFGPCQNDSLFGEGDDPQREAKVRCAGTSDDESDKAKVGRPFRVDRLIPGDPERGISAHWLWSKELGWKEVVTPAAERRVHFAYADQVWTTIYDDALPVTMVAPFPNQRGADPLPKSPAQAGSKLIVQRVQYDKLGNLVRIENNGLIDENDTSTITVFGVEEGGRLPPLLGSELLQLPCSAEWVCSPTYVTTFGDCEPQGECLDSNKRQLKLTYAPNGADVNRVEGLYGYGGVVVNRHHETGGATASLPPGAIGSRHRILSTASYDVFGNVIATVHGPGTGPICSGAEYDAPYQHLPARSFGLRDCTTQTTQQRFIYDRGLATVASVVEVPSNATTTVEFDPFGRARAVYAPNRNSISGLTTLAATMTYSDAAPLPFVDSEVFASPTNGVREIAVLNGLGEQSLRFSEDGNGNSWVLDAFATRNASGAPESVRRPSSFIGNPVAVATNATSPPMSAEYLLNYYDGFGRVSSVAEGTYALVTQAQYVYRPLVVETRDAEQVTGGHHAGAYTRTEYDGHGRGRRTTAHGNGEDVITSVQYTPFGQPSKVTRTGTGGAYERQFTYDLLGRLAASREPNTGEWRYQWDDAGRLTGTSDARGCGKNVHYDGLGRLLGEDYSPCLASQAPYSLPNPATGAGFEVFNRYDAYEPGQTAADPSLPSAPQFADHRLVSVRDRGSHTRLNYDARGSARLVSRRVAKPAGQVGADPYASKWSSQRTDFDSLERSTLRTTGTVVPSLRPYGTSEETYSYSLRGPLEAIQSTYGIVIREIQYEPDGSVRRIQYADAAATKSVFAYGTTYKTRRLERYDVTRTAPSLWSTSQPPEYPAPDWRTTQTELAKFKYSYDDVGNPVLVEDEVDPAQYANRSDSVPIRTRTSIFDDLYRLRSIGYGYAAGGAGGPHFSSPYGPEIGAGDNSPVPLQAQLPTRVQSQSFDYDFMGNLVASSDDLNAYYDRSIGSATYGTPTNGPNQLRSADGITATHDASGNLTELKVTRVGDCISGSQSLCAQWFAYDWDEVGQLVRARRWDYPTTLPALPAGSRPSTTPSWTLNYAYSNGVRVLKSADDGTSKRHTVDVFDTLRLVRAPFDADEGSYEESSDTTELYLAGGAARVFDDSTGMLPRPPDGQTVHMFVRISDHLGSSTAVIDNATGELVSRSSSQAYGAIESDYRTARWGEARDPYKFTGKEEDIEVGLTYFGARYYLPHLGRWASADPLTIHGMGGDLNPYAYVGGRVMSFVDPFGLHKIPDNATQIQEWPAGWSAMVNGQLEYGDYEPGQAHHAVAAAMGADSKGVSIALDLAIGRGLETRIPLGGGHYVTPGGVRDQARNVVVAGAISSALGPIGRLGEIAGIKFSAPFLREVSNEPKDHSQAVGTVAAIVGSMLVGRVGSVAEGVAATERGSVGAMSASERLLNWSTKSTPTWGHTFSRHGQGPSVTRSLIGRAAGTGDAQGQWLSNQAAADFLSAQRPYIQGPTAVRLPSAVEAQVILPNGTIVPTSHALLVPASGGGFVTAFPFLP